MHLRYRRLNGIAADVRGVERRFAFVSVCFEDPDILDIRAFGSTPAPPPIFFFITYETSVSILAALPC